MNSATMARLVSRLACAGLLMIVVAPSSAPAQAVDTRYVVTDVGTFDGASSEAYAINRYGQVVGRAPIPGGAPNGDYPYAWHWENGELKDVGQTTHFHHRYNLWRGECYDVNDDDMIVGGGWCKYQIGNEIYYVITAFVTRFAVQTDFVTPAPGDETTVLGTWSTNTLTNSVATAASNNNHIVGWADLDYNTNIHAFLATPLNGQWFVDANADQINDRLLDLGSLGGLSGDSAATGVNDRGEVVGWSATQNGPYHAYIIVPTDTNADGVGDTWSRDTTPADGVNDLMVDLGTLGGTNSWARGISNFGVVVGESDDGEGNTVAFRIVPEDTNGDGIPDRWARDFDGDGINDLMESLGTLGGNDSSASRLNASGDIVGWAEDENFNVHAFVWRNGVMYDLNDASLSSSRWVIKQARDVNDSGEIVGFGTYKDSVGTVSNHAFHLRVATAAEIAAQTNTDSPGTSGSNPSGGSSSSSGANGQPLLQPIESGQSAETSVTAGETVDSNSTSGAGGLCGIGASFAFTLTLAGLAFGRGIRRR